MPACMHSEWNRNSEFAQVVCLSVYYLCVCVLFSLLSNDIEPAAQDNEERKELSEL